jgi:hypothetical protein
VPTCMILREEGTPKAVSARAGRVGWYPRGGGGSGNYFLSRIHRRIRTIFETGLELSPGRIGGLFYE